MKLVGELISRERESRRIALQTDGRVYSHADLYSTAYQATNFFTYLGVGGGETVEIDPSIEPENVISFLAAARLGAVADFEPTGDGRAVVVPIDREDEFEDLDGTKRVVYGGQPRNASSFHWEMDVWNEVPPRSKVKGAADDPVIATDAAPLRHEDVIGKAADLVGEYGIDEETTVALRAPLAEPGAVIAGVVAPLMAGGTVALDTTSTLGDIGVGVDVVEETEIDPSQVL